MTNLEKIETDRLILSILSPQDMTFVFNNYDRNEIKEILGLHSDEEFRKEEYKQQKGYSMYNRSFQLFLLMDRESGNIIGRAGLHNWCTDHNRAEIGYVMTDKNYLQKGLMTEAVGAVLDYGFMRLALNRIEALVGSGNIPSLRILHKFSFQKEGVLREHHLSAIEYEDSVMLSLLHKEYMANRKKSAIRS